MSDTLLQLLATYGAPLLALTTFASCLALPVPSSLMMLAAGAFVASGDLSASAVAAAAFAGAAAGDQLGYFAGRGGGAFIERKLASRPKRRRLYSRARLPSEPRQLWPVSYALALFSARSLRKFGGRGCSAQLGTLYTLGRRRRSPLGRALRDARTGLLAQPYDSFRPHHSGAGPACRTRQQHFSGALVTQTLQTAGTPLAFRLSRCQSEQSANLSPRAPFIFWPTHYCLNNAPGPQPSDFRPASLSKCHKSA